MARREMDDQQIKFGRAKRRQRNPAAIERDHQFCRDCLWLFQGALLAVRHESTTFGCRIEYFIKDKMTMYQCS